MNDAIDLSRLLTQTFDGNSPTIYADGCFSRRKTTFCVAEDVTATVTADSLDAPGIRVFFMSLSSRVQKDILFEFAGVRTRCHSQGTFVTTIAEDTLFWLPRSPVLREYDAEGRIVSQMQTGSETIAVQDACRLTMKSQPGRKLEFAIVQFRGDSADFQQQILEPLPIETMHVVRSTWFRYRGMNDLWDYYINGATFNTYVPEARRRWPSQNVAWALYYHFDYLHKQTRKVVYEVFRQFLAYAVLLAQSEDGRWRQGSWTDLMETHVIHQTAGAGILLSEYQYSRNDIFLRKACDAADYLASCSEELEGGRVWFLHDTLECHPQHAALRYHDMVLSRAFGKSPQNTLCLNTHVAAITMFQSIYRLTGETRCDAMFKSGLATLEWLLGQRPATLLYALAYAPRDLLVRWVVKSRGTAARQLQRKYEALLRTVILPRLKRRAPRFVMPNGFIERDICFTHLSDFYHLFNLKVLLILYSIAPLDWLADILKASVPRTVKTGLAEYAAVYGDRSAVLSEVLLLYAALIDERYADHLARFVTLLKRLNLPPQADFLSNPFVANPSIALRVDHPEVCIAAPAVAANFEALIINMAECEIETVVSSGDPAGLASMRVVNVNGARRELGGPLTLPPRGYAKIVRT